MDIPCLGDNKETAYGVVLFAVMEVTPSPLIILALKGKASVAEGNRLLHERDQ